MVNIPVIPYGVAIGAEVDIVAVTSVNQGVGGVAGRKKIRQPLRQFTCTVGPNDTPAVRSIHYTHRRRWPVGIRDWGDFIVENEVLTATASGSDYLAPLKRLIQPAPGSRFFTQRILLPDETEGIPIVIKVDGTPLLRSDWVFDDFGIPRIPNTKMSADSVVTWSGRYLTAAKFLDDILSVQVNAQQETATEYGVQSIPQVRFEEILEEELVADMSATDDSV